MDEQIFPPARILGIESSCDETSAAVIANGREPLSIVTATQIEMHAQFGGVFPEVASRQHIKTVYGVIEQALQQAHMSLSDVDAIAVTLGPGLAGSLVVGVNAAKGLAVASGLPLVGVNHLEGHIYSAWLRPPEMADLPPAPQFPLLALLVSGGHTELNLITNHLEYQRLGGTLDDAAGEAFDKVARLLGLPYPGGPSIQEAAKNGNPRTFQFPRSMLEGTWNFSFSGLKTAVLRAVQNFKNDPENLPVNDLAASFQTAVVDVLVSKTLAAAKAYGAKEILLAGGVSANAALREGFRKHSPIKVNIPDLSYCTDNAAMIAAAGYFRFVAGHVSDLDVDVLPNLSLS
ncbi:tRNA threonylcarbamoyladenosine biosynthesis protein Gcp [Ornatilinea apprima]|uniref:tRNA N6-adenosine threonylcarbamoyltransferase n=2 Tax=Ornatilinea apprima TaxID=1134406 RepID=A0A0P6XMC6_9CHLR|nr:tRNA (adenosine(37)-N6)-threonylcarbamoyltransferase complex transferase subunit TsaD [Ornatilinea apprima]KPL70073.1 tRNA threonylcarbamoyladenosine biosynthesis protein Gcp [Ornatilinea apprima]